MTFMELGLLTGVSLLTTWLTTLDVVLWCGYALVLLMGSRVPIENPPDMCYCESMYVSVNIPFKTSV